MGRRLTLVVDNTNILTGDITVEDVRDKIEDLRSTLGRTREDAKLLKNQDDIERMYACILELTLVIHDVGVGIQQSVAVQSLVN